MKIIVERKPNRFQPDFKRVIIRFLDIGQKRTNDLIKKVVEMEDKEVELTLTQTLREFSRRHRNLTHKFLQHFEKAVNLLDEKNFNYTKLSDARKLLIGSYFSMEYSIISAAFFNPSIVESPDQTALEEGSKRIIVSFRATGEGHISSIVFQTGIIDRNSNLIFENTGHHVDEAEVIKEHQYSKKTFIAKLMEMGLDKGIVSMVTSPLNDKFLYDELLDQINKTIQLNNANEDKKRNIKEIMWLADSNYEINFSRDTHISERVIFPISYSERKGIEDARFVRFVDEKGQVRYYATYTAYDGHAILPKLIVTKDFLNFEVKPLHGEGAQNKNLALFPRKINGKYAMLSRIDGINSYIGFSNKINVWDKPKIIHQPKFPWEFIQIGNCGAPIETEKGWLIITHGVGPMRKYCLGASLLDLDDPTKEIGRLKEPLLVPNEEEREGYVPNVVYSCGSIIHNNQVFIPYGLSDTSSGFATVDLNKLFEKLLEN